MLSDGSKGFSDDIACLGDGLRIAKFMLQDAFLQDIGSKLKLFVKEIIVCERDLLNTVFFQLFVFISLNPHVISCPYQ